MLLRISTYWMVTKRLGTVATFRTSAKSRSCALTFLAHKCLCTRTTVCSETAELPTFLRWLQWPLHWRGEVPSLTWNSESVALFHSSLLFCCSLSASEHFRSVSVLSALAAESPSLTVVPAERPHNALALSQLQQHTDSATTTAAGKQTTDTQTGDVFHSAVCLVYQYSISKNVAWTAGWVMFSDEILKT